MIKVWEVEGSWRAEKVRVEEGWSVEAVSETGEVRRMGAWVW